MERCLVPPGFGNIKKCQIHHFSVASLLAYGPVSYLRLVNVEGRIHCALLLGKSKLSPMRQMTISRLELSATVIAVRMDMCSAGSGWRSTSQYFGPIVWLVFSMLSHKKRFQTFVANTLSVIHDGSSPSQWRKVGTKQNPADDVSRGWSAEEVVSSKRWKHAWSWVFVAKRTYCLVKNPLKFLKSLKMTEVSEVSYCVLCSLCARTRQFCGPRSRELLLLVSPQRSVAWLLRLKLG